MRFLLRMAFWLTVVLVLLPSGGSQPAPKVNVSAVDAMSAAGATVSDMKQFCGRQSEACAVGSQVAVALGHRAQAGAKMLYEFLNERLGPHDTGALTKPRREGGAAAAGAAIAAYAHAGRSRAGLARSAAAS